MKTLIVGGGNMGRTFARSFLDAHVLRPADLTIMEQNINAIRTLMEKEWGKIEAAPGPYIGDNELIVLAVKPQDSEALCKSIVPFLHDKHVVLSIMAGVTIDTLEERLGIKKIIRSMPNLPAQVGMGMTAFTANEEVDRKELISVQNLLGTTGKAIYFEDESMIDAATAISGSGPAYVYFFMNAMMKAAKELGFSDSQSDLLVWQTFIGSVHLHNKSNLSCEDWIDRVTSKGGTTEAALNVFKSESLEQGIIDGLKAAFKRARELGSA